MMRFLIWMLFGAGWAMLAPARAEVKPAPIFSDGMVLQRDRPIAVWGTAAPHKTITVSYNNQTISTTSDAQGNWQLALPAMSARSAGGDFTITEAGGNTITLTDVVVGDVWLCSGQSNMDMVLAGCNRQAEDVAAADFPGIRLFRVPWVSSAEPLRNLKGKWTVCSPRTAGGFSAAAFYFARRIYTDQNAAIPIGLLVSPLGGNTIDPFLAPEGLTDIPLLRPLYAMEIMPGGPFHLFNGMDYPLVPYGVKGLIWYQGENSESNVQSPDSYYLKMKALAYGWKRAFGLDDFPFYFVQIANWGDKNSQPTSPTPVLSQGGWAADTRLQQARAMALPHAGMASAVDIGESGDWHPKDKLGVGERLALWALKNDYGRTNLVPSGPILRDVTVSGSKVICTFDYVGAGLMVGSRIPCQPAQEVVGGTLALFSMAGSDGKWSWATAAIVGDTVELTSTSVPAPRKVAYACWTNPLGANLYNRNGLPASPFYVDDVAAKCTVTATAGSGGNISPAGATTLLKRATALYAITPAAGYCIQDVRVDGTSVGSVKHYTFDPLYANHTISATFATTAPTYTITASAGVGGSISPAGAQTVAQAGSRTFSITPKAGCRPSVLVDGCPMGARTFFTFSDIRSEHTISATFNPTIVATAAEGGRISPSGDVAVPYGANRTFTFAPNPGFSIAQATVDGVNQGPIASYTFTNVTASHTISVAFPVAHIAATAGEGGVVRPSGNVLVPRAGSQAFTFATNTGFAVSQVTVDGVNQGAMAGYTFTDVVADHTIAVRFARTGSNLITWYKFDETAGRTAADSSGYGAHGIVANGTWAAGRSGNCLAFNGTSTSLRAPNLGAAHGTFTLATWVNLAELPSGSGWAAASLASTDGWTAGSLALLFLGPQSGPNASKFQFSLNGAAEFWSKKDFSPLLGTWVHLAVVYDTAAGSAKIYVNGVLDASANTSSQLADLSALKIGSWSGNERFLNGKLDDFRIYATALTAAEILALSNEKGAKP